MSQRMSCDSTPKGNGCKSDCQEKEHGPGGEPFAAASVFSEQGEGFDDSPLVHTNLQHCGGMVEGRIGVGNEYEVVAVGCKSRFCRDCCVGLGLRLREKITPVLETFQGMMMLTLTVDPKLFPSPEAAYRYVRQKRCVAELVRALHKAGHLKSRRFFYVVEWQKNTQMAHFHLLVESSFVPFEALCEMWGRFRPKTAGPPSGNAPVFGHVCFSKAKFGSPEHAANYACKYLTKLPEQGFPEWVLKFKGQIRMFATSRGLLPSKPRRPKEPTTPKVHQAPKARRHPPECFCEECRGDVKPPIAGKPEKKVSRRTRATVGERLQRCGEGSALLAVPIFMENDGKRVEGRPYFMEALCYCFADACRLCGKVGLARRRFRATADEVALLCGNKSQSGSEARAKEMRAEYVGGLL